MNRYRVLLLVRGYGANEEEQRINQLTELKVTAESTFHAHRVAMERTWALGLLVSKFEMVKLLRSNV